MEKFFEGCIEVMGPLLGVLFIIGVIVLAVFAPAAIFVFLWNSFIVATFTSAPVLTYWQGFVILIVTGMLFGRRS